MHGDSPSENEFNFETRPRTLEMMSSSSPNDHNSIDGGKLNDFSPSDGFEVSDTDTAEEFGDDNSKESITIGNTIIALEIIFF